MLDRELWLEVYHSIRHNKLRTGLTAIGVFWGIFMLVLLLGAGNGLSNATLENFQESATNAIYVWPRRTSMPYKGFKTGKTVTFKMNDVEQLKKDIPELEYVAPSIQLGQLNINYNSNEKDFTVKGELTDMFKIESLKILSGRKLNLTDIQEKRKVAVVGLEIIKTLNNGGSMVGEYIKIGEKDFLVVGEYEKASSIGSKRGDPNANIYIPLSVAQNYLPVPDIFHWFICTVDPKADINKVEEKIKAILKERHNVHPKDKSGVGSWNKGAFFMKFQNMFSGINMFIWMVGLGSLFAGIIGVSNVMLISVKERTKEIGLRKALGATPRSLINMILLESLVITFISGYLGLLIGTGIITLIEYILTSFNIESQYFKRPEIDLITGISSLVLIIVAGIIAGIYPARQAANMDPVEALRNE